jgi:hypothetical protein
MHQVARLFAVPVALFALACSGDLSGAGPAAPPESISAIDTATINGHIRVLAHDSLLGRAPGSLGEDRTVAYLESQFKAIGLKPGNTDGTYIQKVPLVGITVQGAPTGPRGISSSSA